MFLKLKIKDSKNYFLFLNASDKLGKKILLLLIITALLTGVTAFKLDYEPYASKSDATALLTQNDLKTTTAGSYSWIKSSNYARELFWRDTYRGTYSANRVIEAIKDGVSAYPDQLKCENLYLKVLSHFFLVRFCRCSYSQQDIFIVGRLCQCNKICRYDH